jgi:hypothetical protein
MPRAFPIPAGGGSVGGDVHDARRAWRRDRDAAAGFAGGAPFFADAVSRRRMVSRICGDVLGDLAICRGDVRTTGHRLRGLPSRGGL